MSALRRIAVALLCTLLVSFAGPGSAQTEPSAQVPPASNIQDFTRLLADEQVQEWIRLQAEDADTAAETETPGMRTQLDALVLHTQRRIASLVGTWDGLEQAPEMVGDRWREQVTDDEWVRSMTFVLIFLFLGAGLEWLFRQYSDPVRRRLENSKFKSHAKRITAAVTRTGLALAGLLAFAIGSIGAFAAFDWPPILFTLILDLLMTVLAIRLVSTTLLLFFAPFAPRLRLVPVSTPMARLIARGVGSFSAVLIGAIAFRDVFAQVVQAFEQQGGEGIILAVSVMLALIVSLAALLCLHGGFFLASRITPAADTKAARRWRGFLSFLILLALGFWMLDLRLIMWSVLAVGTLIVALKLLRAWVDHAFDSAIADYMAKLPPQPIEVEEESAEHAPADFEPEDVPKVQDPYDTYRPIAQRVVRFAAIIIVGFVLSLIWNLGIFERVETPTVLQQVFSVLLDSAAALLIADLVWTWARTAIDRRLGSYSPPVDGSAPGPEARMATLLPLLRVVLMVTLLLMVTMSVLSSMGVNIAPILAGASVLGIAVGFGAQSLVKDVFSGIFFLIDDAFRVGEYVEIDQLRGTVERISIRSLQIRHHRGAVHTLPFGELKSMTNYSRDWVIMKLEFRVPFDTDLKLVKKLIKQVGAQLKQNPEYGDAILETLKSQGVRRMEEFNMVVGVKFMTRPGEQWLVRRDAYQGVRDVFEANGIRMAERNVKVEIAGDEGLSEPQRQAVTAAAHEATVNKLPPGPIPDEP